MSQRTRILIADNSKDFVWLLVQFLSKQPEVEIIGVAYDGEQAVEMIKQMKPDVLLLDIIMPNMDGIEVFRRVRNENREMEIILISAIDNLRLVENSIGVKIEHYFKKPFNFYEILPLLRNKAAQYDYQ